MHDPEHLSAVVMSMDLRQLRDGRPLPVWLAWWRDDPPPLHAALIRLTCDMYGNTG